MARVVLFPDALEDIEGLDGAERKLVFKGLKKLTAEPEKRGQPLGSGLTTFRKLVVGDRQIRIVYRVEDNGDVAVVWVVASRVDSKCYDLAMARLALYASGAAKTALEGLVNEVFES
jgi:mRNA interferase RelE/StbE